MNIDLNLSCFSSSPGDSEGQTLGDSEGPGSLMLMSMGSQSSDMTE